MFQVNGKRIFKHVAYASAQTAATFHSPTSGKKVAICGYVVSTTAANIVTIILGSTDIVKLDLAANGGANLSSPVPIYVGAADEAIKITTSAATNAYITIFGYEI